jgi:hypothetical protein
MMVSVGTYSRSVDFDLINIIKNPEVYQRPLSAAVVPFNLVGGSSTTSPAESSGD